MGENADDSIDVERLSNELQKYEKMLEGEDSDNSAAGESCLDTNSLELGNTPSFLDKYLMSVAKTGNPILPWKKIHTFLHHKIDSILSNFYEKYGIEDIDSQNLPPFNYFPAKEKLLQHFDTFTGAPFTIQRLCEILIDPGRHYKRTDKLLRGLEKNILVVSTIGRLSADCSNPQQRSMLFNGLQMTTFRSFRPPLPDHVAKYSDSGLLGHRIRREERLASIRKQKREMENQDRDEIVSRKGKRKNTDDSDDESPQTLQRQQKITCKRTNDKIKHKNQIKKRHKTDLLKDPSDDVEMKDEDEDDVGVGVGSEGRLNGDDSDLLDEDENSFEDECLKHDLDDEDMDDLDSGIRSRLNTASNTDGVVDNYGLSVSSVIEIRRKRKEDHRQQLIHSKRIRMEQMIRVQEQQQDKILDNSATTHQQSSHTGSSVEDEQTKEEGGGGAAEDNNRLPLTPEKIVDDISSDDEPMPVDTNSNLTEDIPRQVDSATVDEGKRICPDEPVPDTEKGRGTDNQSTSPDLLTSPTKDSPQKEQQKVKSDSSEKEKDSSLSETENNEEANETKQTMEEETSSSAADESGPSPESEQHAKDTLDTTNTTGGETSTSAAIKSSAPVDDPVIEGAEEEKNSNSTVNESTAADDDDAKVVSDDNVPADEKSVAPDEKDTIQSSSATTEPESKDKLLQSAECEQEAEAGTEPSAENKSEEGELISASKDLNADEQENAPAKCSNIESIDSKEKEENKETVEETTVNKEHKDE